MVSYVEAKPTNDAFYGYEDHENYWKDCRTDLAKYVKACERWSPVYRRISTVLRTPKISDYADLMDLRVKEIQEAVQLMEKLMVRTKDLDSQLKELEIAEDAEDDQLAVLVSGLPAFIESAVVAAKIEQIYEQWDHEDADGYFDTSLEEYFYDGKLRTQLDNGAIPSSLVELADLVTAAFGYLQGVLSPDTIREYADEVEE